MAARACLIALAIASSPFSGTAFASDPETASNKPTCTSPAPVAELSGYVKSLWPLVNSASCSGILLHGQKPHLNGKLTPYWAQELMGADLAADELSKTEGLQEVPVALEDSNIDFDNLPQDRIRPGLRDELPKELLQQMKTQYTHGSAVANLILREPPLGAGYKTRLVDFAKTSRVNGNEEQARLNAHRRFLQTKPRIVNISTDIGGTEAEKESYEKLSKDTLCVIASGNDYSVPLTSHQKTINGILVGSLNPIGGSAQQRGIDTRRTVDTRGEGSSLQDGRSHSSVRASAASGRMRNGQCL